MTNDIYLKKPPEKYTENFVQYTEGLDTFPEQIHFVLHGFTLSEAERMQKIWDIEAFKHYIKEAESDGDISGEELLEAERYLAEKIERYNSGL